MINRYSSGARDLNLTFDMNGLLITEHVRIEQCVPVMRPAMPCQTQVAECTVHDDRRNRIVSLGQAASSISPLYGLHHTLEDKDSRRHCPGS